MTGSSARSFDADGVRLRDGRDGLRARAEDVEVAVADEARRARRHVDEDERAHRVVGVARLDVRLGRRIAVQREVALEAVDGRLEVRADDLAALGEIGVAQELLDVEARAVEVDLHALDELARDDAGDDEHPCRRLAAP